MRKIERLECKVKNYKWGKQGEDSEVALLYAAGNRNAKIDNIPYAELWIGTHPDGPAKISAKNMALSEYMVEEGSKTNRHLPYIMKIMSISHNLSLQVHPTKEQAKLLNKKDPVNYPDPNHKPELAYALTQFELLCGFRPADEIIFNMKAFPELCLAMGNENCAYFIAAKESNNTNLTETDLSQLLKRCFSCMMRQDKLFIRDIVDCLIRRIKSGAHGCLTKETVKVLLNLYKRFPNDVACISPLILNHIILQPGECVFYGAQELHSYLSGECVECVSCSNNTIRAGLTTKFVDKDNLLKILNYRMADPSSYYVLPRRLKSHRHVHEFIPNCNDFMLQCLRIGKNDLFPLDLPALECPSTFIVVEAEEAICIELNKNGTIISEQFRVRRGDVFFIPPANTLRFLSAKSAVHGYRTYSFEHGPDFTNRTNCEQISSTNGFLDKRRPNAIKVVPLAAKFLEVEAEDGFI
uniref:mannose-6-phosphate isomerase n=1 Tax=Globodera pallida TaxID=36090 RepID=A0A183BRE2_GLOPA